MWYKYGTRLWFMKKARATLRSHVPEPWETNFRLDFPLRKEEVQPKISKEYVPFTFWVSDTYSCEQAPVRP